MFLFYSIWDNAKGSMDRSTISQIYKDFFSLVEKIVLWKYSWKPSTLNQTSWGKWWKRSIWWIWLWLRRVRQIVGWWPLARKVASISNCNLVTFAIRTVVTFLRNLPDSCRLMCFETFISGYFSAEQWEWAMKALSGEAASAFCPSILTATPKNIKKRRSGVCKSRWENIQQVLL